MHRDSAFPSARQSPEKTFGTQWDRLARHPSIMAGLLLKGKAVKAFGETIADEIEVVEQLTSYLARYPAWPAR